MDENTSTAPGFGAVHSESAGAPTKNTLPQEMSRAEYGDAANQDSEEVKDGIASERKKRDRWTAAPANDDDSEGAKGTEVDSSKKKSRWGTKQEELPPSNLAMVPFGMPGSLVRFGNTQSVGGAFNSQMGSANTDQVKIQIRIAEIQSLYGRPRCPHIPPARKMLAFSLSTCVPLPSRTLSATYF